MNLLEKKAGSNGTCLGTQGTDRLTCLCWTGTTRDLNIFLWEIWGKEFSADSAVGESYEEKWEESIMQGWHYYYVSFSEERRKKFYF